MNSLLARVHIVELNKMTIFTYNDNTTSTSLNSNISSSDRDLEKDLIAVDFGDEVNGIAANAFFDCTFLSRVKMSNNITVIGSQAFSSCSSLTNIIIGNKLNTVGSYAFLFCTSLLTVTFLGNCPIFFTDAFLFANANLKIYRYSTKSGWPSIVQSRPVELIDQNIKGLKTFGFGINSTGKTSIKKQNLGGGKLNLNKKYLYKATGIGLTPNIDGLRFYLSGISALGYLSFRDETNTYELYYTPFGAQFAIRPLPFSVVTPPTIGWTKGLSSNPTDPPTGNYTQSAGGYNGIVTISEI